MNRLANGLFGGGDGTELNPYLVEDAQDLNAVRNDYSAYYKQSQNIDLSIYTNWKPIHDYPGGIAFTGSYDGGDFIIDNLTVESDTENYLALFGLCVGAKLKNIHIRNANIGSIVGSQKSQQGGILATVASDCEVFNCTTSGKVLLDINDFCSASGFIAVIEGTSLVEKCAAIDVTVSASIVGLFCFTYTGDKIKNCYGQGSLIGFRERYNASSYIAGFVHSHYNGVIENCYANAKISYIHHSDTERGPEVSVFSSTANPNFLVNCFADVEEYGPIQWEELRYYNRDTHIKGTDGKIYSCINSQSEKDYYYDPSWEMGPPEWWPGAFTRAQPISGEVYAEHWELDSSSTNKTTSEMFKKETFIDWDFDNIWTIKEGVSYPTFKLKRAIIKCKRVPLSNYRR